MERSILAQEIRAAFPALDLREQEPMKAHTSFRIGGPAEVYAEPDSEETLCALWRFLTARGVPVAVIGNGTNLLVHDEGVKGAVLRLGERFSAVYRRENALFACAGVTLARLAVFAREQGLAGLEFAHGIPGSLGGAVMMNAGAYGGEMADVVRTVRCMAPDGSVHETGAPGFSYRRSRFTDSGEVILGAALSLTPDDPAAIHGRMMELWNKRSASQPLDRPSAGSTFKRPQTGYAAALIDAAGLKGACVGAARVSEKHAGFVINTGGATFADVTALMARIQETVFEQSGVHLEPEFRIL